MSHDTEEGPPVHQHTEERTDESVRTATVPDDDEPTGRHAVPPDGDPEPVAASDGPDAGAEPADVDDQRPPPATPTPPPSAEVLAAAVETLREALAASRQAQDRQQMLLEKLHEEKERLRESEQRRQRDPVLRDLIQLSDTCLRTARQWRDRTDIGAETTERVSAALVEAAQDVGLILERQGVTDFAPVVGDPFVRNETRAVGVLPTADPALDSLVAEVRKPGYRLDDRVLRFSEVKVWRLNTDAGQPASPS